jgi:hypothetical protein
MPHSLEKHLDAGASQMKEQKINQLIEMLEILRETAPDLTINMMLALFEVAKGHGVTGRELEIKYDLKHATAARILRFFDKMQTANKEGLDLLRVELDPTDYKAKLRYLNDRGEALLSRIDGALK